MVGLTVGDTIAERQTRQQRSSKKGAAAVTYESTGPRGKLPIVAHFSGCESLATPFRPLVAQ
jgi:hypothetical protein